MAAMSVSHVYWKQMHLDHSSVCVRHAMRCMKKVAINFGLKRFWTQLGESLNLT